MIRYKLDDDNKIRKIERYDRVLVRNGEEEAWKEDFYWSEDPKNPKVHICGEGDYRFYIPLNEETRHLKGTSDKYDKFIEI